MSVEVVMPKLSDTMEEGTILQWLKKVGDQITSGEPIAEVQTDKADMELEAAESGVLQEIKVQAGENAAVGAVIALIDEQGKAPGAPAREPERRARGDGNGDAAIPRGASAQSAENDQSDATDDESVDGDGSDAAAPAEQASPRRERPQQGVASRDRDPAARTPAAAAAALRERGSDSPARDAGHGAPAADVKASPSARKIAAERGIDLRSVRGTGPAGRIVKEDVQRPKPADGDAAPVERSAPRAARASDAGAVRARGQTPDDDRHAEGSAPPLVSERHELSRMRQSIARRMTEAFREIPHFYVRTTIDMTEAVRLKKGLEAGELTDTPITYTHLVLKATALALRRHPRLNASYRDDAIELKGEINIGLAVAVEDGLIVPILRHVDELSLDDIAREAHRLSEQAKRGRFAREDLSGGTFTVSNMGMLDIEDFAAVINPPQAAILAVGAIKERPMVRDGAVVAARTMPVTLSCDHRIIDGVVGGRFLEELKRLLENPLVLAVGER